MRIYIVGGLVLAVFVFAIFVLTYFLYTLDGNKSSSPRAPISKSASPHDTEVAFASVYNSAAIAAGEPMVAGIKCKSDHGYWSKCRMLTSDDSDFTCWTVKVRYKNYLVDTSTVKIVEVSCPKT
jgi:hypothetical protein